ncbi:exonuclease SbcCD subunit D [Rudaeicoccus suwonensis]|uniref:Nuclease SbcCD subunit D n=1 Tax=Rudaeicoccus suwonensis TaxID=657409 RepID=A0A561EB68_9MICO|nr:exonuclease SbcCD subunit D [Rudaeicoccus suwonensis]TWE12842.1 exodeoxyribonuclease I subunit D [Rudaeicoccus suwonensis]
MRLIHTSDWHLGRGFHGVGLLGAQAHYLDHLVDLVTAEGVDAVLVSGDIYDRALPSPDAVALLDDALARLLSTGAQVIMSSGNHDSAIRLGFGSRVMEHAGLHIRTSVDSIGRPVDLGGAVVYPIPYLEPSVAAPVLGADERTHAGVLRAAMSRIRADMAYRQVPSVAMAHSFVTGATTSDSERDISVGGLGAVPLDVFADVSYAALGHLHGHQALADGVRYSGSPVAMSFSETDHVKGSILVDLGSGQPGCELVPAPVERRLARLRGTLPELLADRSLDWAQDAWCQVALTDQARPRGAMARIRARFPHTVQLEFAAPGGDLARRSYAARIAGRTDVDLCCDFLQHVRGGVDTTPGERQVLSSAFAAAAANRAEHEGEGQVRVRRETGAA